MGRNQHNFFLNLENRNFTTKIIPKIEKDNGGIITKQDDILNEVKTFYENLYSDVQDIRDVNLDEFLENVDIPKLDNLDSFSL